MSEKLIVLTEYYPPCNLTAAYRPFSWTKYLKNFGYYPVVFCKNLENNNEHRIVKDEFFEVHYLPFKEGYFQRKKNVVKISSIRRTLGFLNYIFENSIVYNGIKGFEPIISNYIVENNVKKMISTAPGYSIFGLSFILSKKHRIKWIADYRDDWTTTELNFGFFFRIKNMFDFFKEKRYLSNCSCFSTVSKYYIAKIGHRIKAEGHLLENGFEPEDNREYSNQNINRNLTILYPGLLYKTQKIKLIGDALDMLPPNIIDEVQFTFLGTESKQIDLPKNLIKYVDKNVFFTKRVERSEANQFLNDTDLLLFLPHHSGKSLKGIPSSKLYDFIRLRKTVLVCPSDEDIVEEKLTETGQGVFCNTANELASNIKRMVKFKKDNGFIPLVDIPDKLYKSNSREFQTGKLAAILDKL
ncbi:MAG: hypothetical protein ACTHM7_06270 [Ginsengibacter sp.]